MPGMIIFIGRLRTRNTLKRLTGFWSVRIDEKNRIVFRIEEGFLEIVECGSHYGDK